MRRRDKVDGLRALVDEAQERFAQGLRRQRFARAPAEMTPFWQ